jgi:predicted phage tail protein
MLRKIKLYGKLAKFIGKRVLKADVATAAEAVRFLLANWPELEAHMQDQHYRVSVGTYDLDQDELHDPAGQQEIKIVPVLAGAGAVGKIVAGVALVALAIAAPYIAGALVWAGTLSYAAGSALIAIAPLIGMIGASVAIGGISQLISPVAKTPTGMDSQQDPRKSYSFSGIQNVSGRQGVPVPVVYGETIVGSVVISAGIDTVQVTA